MLGYAQMKEDYAQMEQKGWMEILEKLTVFFYILNICYYRYFVLLYPLNCYSVIHFHSHSVGLFSPAMIIRHLPHSVLTHDIMMMCGSVWRLSRWTDDS